MSVAARSRRPQRSHDVAFDGERGREPPRDAVGALWLDGSFWFQTGSGTREGRNVAHDPRCSIAVSILDADVVAEGVATRELTRPRSHACQGWADQGWPAELDETRTGITAPFNAPSRATPVERVSHQATFGDRDIGHRAGRADSLQVLDLSPARCLSGLANR